MLAWFEKLQAGQTRFFGVSGNHDWLVDKPNDEGGWLQHGDVVVAAGVNVMCRPWVGEIESPVGPTVVLAHAPPEGTEVASVRGWNARGDFSARLVAEGLQGSNGIVLSSHVHQPNQWVSYVGDVACFNPGCDFSSGRIPRHIVIDTVKRRAELVTAEGVDEPVKF